VKATFPNRSLALPSGAPATLRQNGFLALKTGKYVYFKIAGNPGKKESFINKNKFLGY